MYSPKISPENVIALYQLKQKLKVPMTYLANQAVREFLNKASVSASKPVLTNKEEKDDEQNRKGSITKTHF